MKLCVLGSGSSGNCTYIDTGQTRILVDLGFGQRSLSRRLNEAGLSLDGLSGLFLTHEHTDHISGVPSLARALGIPVFMTEGTWAKASELQALDKVEFLPIDSPFSFGKLEIEAFPVSHDAAQPVGFRFSTGETQGVLATDLGEPTEPIFQHLATCDWLIMESNYDEEMLRASPYPWPLKKRLMGRHGHLSNNMLASCLKAHLGERAQHVLLAHLSRVNNHPGLAMAQVSNAFPASSSKNSFYPRLHLTHQDRPSIFLDI